MNDAKESMPTLEQVEEEVLNAEAEMASAMAKKDYRRAAELHVKLPGMHNRHTAVAAATRSAMSRKQKVEEIHRLEGEVGGSSKGMHVFVCTVRGVHGGASVLEIVSLLLGVLGLLFFFVIFVVRSCYDS